MDILALPTSTLQIILFTLWPLYQETKSAARKELRCGLLIEVVAAVLFIAIIFIFVVVAVIFAVAVVAASVVVVAVVVVVRSDKRKG